MGLPFIMVGERDSAPRPRGRRLGVFLSPTQKEKYTILPLCGTAANGKIDGKASGGGGIS